MQHSLRHHGSALAHHMLTESVLIDAGGVVRSKNRTWSARIHGYLLTHYVISALICQATQA